MTWYRTDKETGRTEPVSVERMLQVMEGLYKDPQLAIEASKETGRPRHTPCAVYEWKVRP